MHLTRLGPCRRKIHIEYVSDNNTLAILWCSCFLVSYPSDAIDLKIQNPIWDNQMGKIHPPGPGPRFLRFFSNFRWNKMEAAPWCLRMGPGPRFLRFFSNFRLNKMEAAPWCLRIFDEGLDFGFSSRRTADGN